MRLCPRKDLLVFALHLDPSPALNKHAHIKPCMVAPCHPILALWLGKIYTDGKLMLNLFRDFHPFLFQKTGKCRHIFSGGGSVTLRACRLTACPAAPGPNDSLFNTSAESGAAPGTSAAGWQGADPVSPSQQPAARVRNKWETWGRQSGRDRKTDREKKGKRGRDWERMYRICLLVPGDLQKACVIGIFHLKMVWPSHIQVAKCFLGDLQFHLEKKPLSSL